MHARLLLVRCRSQTDVPRPARFQPSQVRLAPHRRRLASGTGRNHCGSFAQGRTTSFDRLQHQVERRQRADLLRSQRHRVTSMALGTLPSDAQAMFSHGVEAVLGDRLIIDSVSFDETAMLIADHAIRRDSFDRIVVVGAGKASAAMAAGLSKVIRTNLTSANGEDFPVIGHVNVPEGCHRDLPTGRSQRAHRCRHSRHRSHPPIGCRRWSS